MANTIEKIITLLAKPFQRLDNLAIDLATKVWDVDLATGVQLDRLGKLVGQVRNGYVDDVYRRYIRARIAVNRSKGKRADLIKIARLILNDSSASLTITRQANATLFIVVGGVLPASTEIALATMLRDASPLGVRWIVQSAPLVAASMFKFSGGTAGPGFGSSVHPGTGGGLADMQDGDAA
jgi:hypothetical protein